MENLQIRLPEEEISEMEELIGILHMSKSEVARNALHEGIKALKLEIAQKKYLSNELHTMQGRRVCQCEPAGDGRVSGDETDSVLQILGRRTFGRYQESKRVA